MSQIYHNLPKFNNVSLTQEGTAGCFPYPRGLLLVPAKCSKLTFDYFWSVAALSRANRPSMPVVGGEGFWGLGESFMPKYGAVLAQTDTKLRQLLSVPKVNCPN